MEEYEIQAEYEKGGVQYAISIAQDDTPVRGNAMASGSDDYDREVEDAILARLENGETWAWCIVRVTATAGGITGSDYLGGCSYEDWADFKSCGYWVDLEHEARGELMGGLEAAGSALADLLA